MPASLDLSISVALCTYNGAAYLAEQLESLANQSRLPCELVVTDDGSTDDTCAMVETFRRRAPFDVRLVRNDGNLGSTKNFEKSISLCTGDLVSLSDQDDVWERDKLSVMAPQFEADPEVAMMFCDGHVVDQELQPLGYTILQANGFLANDVQQTLQQQGLFACQVKRNAVCGAGTMFRRSFVSDVIPIPPQWVHDAWIATVLSASQRVRHISQPLFQYRQHQAQQIGERRLSLREQVRRARAMGVHYFETELTKANQLIERLIQLGVEGDSLRLASGKSGSLPRSDFIVEFDLSGTTVQITEDRHTGRIQQIRARLEVHGTRLVFVAMSRCTLSMLSNDLDRLV